MSRILCVWELGEGLGHIGKLSVVIHELLQRGHEVLFAAQNLSRVNDFFVGKDVKFLQAPVWLHQLKRPMVTRCFAEILLYKGYQSEATLRPLVDAWMNLFLLVDPDLIIFDHSPTALLASRKLSVPRVVLSNSFVTPPKGGSYINFHPWDSEKFIYSNIENHNNHIVGVINQVLNSYSMPVIDQISDLFEVDTVILDGFAEIDLYRHLRHDALYIGSMRSPSVGNLQKAVWCADPGVNIFAYLKYGMEKVDLLLDILSRMPVNVLCFYAGAKPEEYQRYQSSRMLVSNQPFDLEDVLARANVVVCHAGMGMVGRAVSSGCPMILLPMQLEQVNTSLRLEEMNLAVIVRNDDSLMSIEKKIKSVIEQPHYFEQAKAFAANQLAHLPTNAAQLVCNICEALLVEEV